MLRDVRFAVRQLRSNPGFATAAVVSLGLGIGATTSIFSLGNGLLNKHIEAAQPERLARVYRNAHSPLPYPDLRGLQDAARTFSGLVGEQPIGVSLSLGDATERVDAALVTGNFFATLGIAAAAGHLFSYAPEQEETVPPVVVLAHDYWRNRFGGDPAVVGRTIRINDHPFTVVGVAAAGFTSSQLMWRPGIFIPVGQVGSLVGTGLGDWQGTLYVTGRLAPDADLGQAHAEVALLWRRFREADPTRDERTTARVAGARGITAEVRAPLTVGLTLLLAMVGLVLLIACANVANLLLARASARRREIAARLALGASRGRLVRQLLTESLALAAIGGGVGYGIAAAATALFPRLLPAQFPVSFDPAPDGAVVFFGIAVTLLTGLLFGLVPALQASAPALVPALKNAGGGTGLARSRLRDTLITAQVALCVVCIATAGLFARSLAEARTLDAGFDPAGVLDLPLYLEAAGHDAVTGAGFYREVTARVEAEPAIRSAALARIVPLSGSNSGGALIRQGIDEAEPGGAPTSYRNQVSPGYFDLLGILVLRGRAFSWDDGPGAPGVVVLNRTAAERLWPRQDPIGRRLAIDDPAGPFLEVVGVVEDTKYNTPGEAPQSFAYLPVLQRYSSEVVLHVRSSGEMDEAAAAVREILAELDPRVGAGAIRTMDEDMRVSLLPARIGALLLGIFGLVALVIAAVGIWGVTSYAVSRRTREIGIRASLGARRGDVLRLIVGSTLRRVAVGVAIGVVLAVGAGRGVASLLYGVSALDPASTVATPVLLAVVALIAAYLPARRAARVDPMEALRHE